MCIKILNEITQKRPDLRSPIYNAPKEEEMKKQTVPRYKNIRYPGKYIIMKHSLPRHQKKERCGSNYYKTNVTYETTDTQTAKDVQQQ